MIEFTMEPLSEHEFRTLQDRASDAQRLGRFHRNVAPALYTRGEEAIRLFNELAFVRHPPTLEDPLYQQALLIGCNVLQHQIAGNLRTVLDANSVVTAN